MSKTRYTGVTKDDKTGNILIILKLELTQLLVNLIKERRRGLKTAKEAFEVYKSIEQGTNKRRNYIPMDFLRSLWKKLYAKLLRYNKSGSEHRRQVIFDEFIQYFGKKNLEKYYL